jgi:hypothetical protein
MEVYEQRIERSNNPTNGTLSSGLRLYKRSGILFMTDYLK